MTPTQKQALSGLLAAMLGAGLTFANQNLHLLPGIWGVLGALVLTGISHALPALGTKDKIEAKAQAIATEAVSRES